MEDYKEWSEERLVAASQKGDSLALEFLIKSYQGLLNYVCEKYFLKDGDMEDLLQEATIGLIEAVYAFSSENGKKFKNFAMLCITRELDSCIKRSNRKKHQILNEAIPIYSFTESEAERNGRGYTSFMEKVLKDNAPSPETIYLEKEKVNELLTKINDTLTEMEKKVLKLRISGHSYNEITLKLNLQNKSVDNAIQRIRKKMSRDSLIRTA